MDEMLKLNGNTRKVPTIKEGDRITVGWQGGT
jgi:hypothetical protein